MTNDEAKAIMSMYAVLKDTRGLLIELKKRRSIDVVYVDRNINYILMKYKSVIVNALFQLGHEEQVIREFGIYRTENENI